MNLDNFYQTLHGNFSDYDLEELKKTPQYRFGMFIKIINNKDYFRKNIRKVLKEEENENVIEFEEFLVYNRAWYWIKDFDLNDPGVDDVYNYDEALLAFDLSIKYFEKVEDYEKCSYLFSFKSLLKMLDSPKNS
jgi:hypothetical protein